MTQLKKIIRLAGIGMAALACLWSCSDNSLRNEYPVRSQQKEAYALIERTIGSNKAKSFEARIGTERSDSLDWYSVYGEDGKVVLEGNNGISIASAFKAYLEDCCHCQITWCGENLDLPTQLPLPEERIDRTSPYKWRYYLNYCTFNYTMSWWQEDRWQKEIDFMAMNGINMPLAVTGQSSIWQRVYKKLGFSDEDLEKFFCGPTYFSWFWMGNLDAWGGPLPQSFIDRHEQLQKFILRKERLLGMKPVLPAFTGHVLPAFSEKYPDAKVRQTSWCNFNPVNILDPTDSMFTVLGKMFLEEQTKTYGTNHFYSADTFNENDPPTHDSTYISGMGRMVYEAMSAYDPDAIWVMQGWLFYSSAHFWHEAETKALLGGVPDDKMLILDLWSDRAPVWNRTEGYYGKPWIWCMLQNFGQCQDFEGNVFQVAADPAAALKDSVARGLQGIGATMEGIEQSPSVYALLFENVWRDTAIDLDGFMSEYLKNRYGADSKSTEHAWQLLNRSVFDERVSGGKCYSTVCFRPRLAPNAQWLTEQHQEKFTKPLYEAWDSLMEAGEASEDLRRHDGFQYDIVDVTRQVLAEYANKLHAEAIEAYSNGDMNTFREKSAAFLDLLNDMDKTVGTRKEFLMGKWIADARAYGTNEAEADQFEQNARNLLTTWGGRNSYLHDYAHRHWSGLLSSYYRGRWQMFFDALANTFDGQAFDYNAFLEKVYDFEWNWTFGHEKYAETPSGDPCEVCKEMHDKYADKL